VSPPSNDTQVQRKEAKCYKEGQKTADMTLNRHKEMVKRLRGQSVGKSACAREGDPGHTIGKRLPRIGEAQTIWRPGFVISAKKKKLQSRGR
jgi:hypothetical protein